MLGVIFAALFILVGLKFKWFDKLIDKILSA